MADLVKELRDAADYVEAGGGGLTKRDTENFRKAADALEAMQAEIDKARRECRVCDCPEGECSGRWSIFSCRPKREAMLAALNTHTGEDR